MEHGETLEEACIREANEECGKDIKFTFNKILHVRDYFDNESKDQSVEFIVLDSFNKYEGPEGLKDPEHPDGSACPTWLSLDDLLTNLLLHKLTSKLLTDYKNGFSNTGKYIGRYVQFIVSIFMPCLLIKHLHLYIRISPVRKFEYF